MAVTLVAAACTGTAPEPAPVPEMTPVTGGRADFGVVGELRTLDPTHPAATDLTRALVAPLYSKLFSFAPDGTVVPDLAESLESFRDRAIVHLDRRLWSNGRRIKASDVVMSAQRATRYSGFSGLEARVIDRGTVEFSGTVEFPGRARSWEETLARDTFVLPAGRFRPRWMTSGPFEMGPYEAGLKLVLKRSETWEGRPAFLDEVTVWFVESLDILLELLDRGELDAAALPSSVNLDERVEEMGLEHAERLGWEVVYLRFKDAGLPGEQWTAVSRRIDRDGLIEGFVRDDGRLTNSLHPAPCCWDGFYSHVAVPSARKPDQITIAAPSGDELLDLMQRAIQTQLERRGIVTEIVVVPADRLYGGFVDATVNALLQRRSGAPGLYDPPIGPDVKALPIAHVETMLAWRSELGGLEVNPTIEGPLWNLGEWFRNSRGL